jgi:organic radical activating enzyme
MVEDTSEFKSFMAATDAATSSTAEAHFRELRYYLDDPRFRPIYVTGPPSVGKSMLVREFFRRYRPRNTRLEWLNLSLERNPRGSVARMIARIRQHKPKSSFFVVLDGGESLSQNELENVINRLSHLKVQNVIVTTRRRSTSLQGREIYLGPPDGKLYGLREQIIVPRRTIVSLVRPQIITLNEVLIERLKRNPDDIFHISPRQFEEVIADLLSGMGMEVELTPTTRDGGKDILAYMDSPLGKLLTLVEAKQYNKNRPVGVSLVRTLYGTLEDYKATNAVLVTTSRFARPAQQFQERHKWELSLRDYKDVVTWILKHKAR